MLPDAAGPLRPLLMGDKRPKQTRAQKAARRVRFGAKHVCDFDKTKPAACVAMRTEAV